ncbi:MAG: helix-turn-helix domain-containing protein [Notoacmeibacter sp.]|nr:helix-turn-helix domain-containing protein [Notoacmeibacter sp.]
MDKRDLSEIFRARLVELIERSGQSHAEFARKAGIDRSALSQLLSGRAARLPRAETLANIAESRSVSLDWLLGFSQAEEVAPEILPAIEIEERADTVGETLLAQWHAEAAGTKVRYVPARIPDLLRTQAVIAYESRSLPGAVAQTRISEAETRIDYNRRPETDMEVCMTLQALRGLALGEGIWSDLPVDERRRQMLHMARLIEELYPTFRLFLYDGRNAWSVPYTVFGQKRAAIYAGDMYLVLNSTDSIRSLTRHFDSLIRKATVNPHEVTGHIKNLISLL